MPPDTDSFFARLEKIIYSVRKNPLWIFLIDLFIFYIEIRDAHDVNRGLANFILTKPNSLASYTYTTHRFSICWGTSFLYMDMYLDNMIDDNPQL